MFGSAERACCPADGAPEPPLDHCSPEFAGSWRAIYSDLRRRCPVAHTSAHGGYYFVTRAADVLAVLRDPATYSSAREIPGVTSRGGVAIPPNAVRMGFMEMDPPEHTGYRRLLTPAFSQTSIDAHRPRIREIVTERIDAVIERGRLDVVEHLAAPVPVLVTLHILGLPEDRWERYARILHEAVYRERGSAHGIAWLVADLRQIVVEGTFRDGGLVAGLQSGAGLSEDLIVEFVFMVLNGGTDTSTSLIASALRYLAAHPTSRQRLLAQPELMPYAVEEMIRYFAPATGVARTVTRPVRLGGVDLEAGDRILLALGSANLDEAQFGNADELVLDRDPNPHRAFGFGHHRCLGARLVPTEMQILLGEVLRRMPDLEVDEERTVPYPTMPLINGYVTMPATFSPGSRERRESVVRAP